jgi:NAD(P)-dependent dehydrogenase (short-subunit alcohol dehydrogenase family)
MDFGLKGKIAIVTGAAGGIGRAIARDLANEGVNLSLCYHLKKCDDLIDESNEFINLFCEQDDDQGETDGDN